MLQPVTKDPRFQGTMTSMNKTICSVAWKNLDSESINIVFLFWNIDCAGLSTVCISRSPCGHRTRLLYFVVAYSDNADKLI
jgi:hypothetical protein